ncbi:MAG: putative molybdenum carrier protein [Desulfosarcinaceae bacterium]|nr:putative molybdenum carrier protein [Desulfosarcinaceae bacterium]
MFARLLAGPCPGVSRAALKIARKLGLASGGYTHAGWDRGDAAVLEERFGLQPLVGQELEGAVRRMILESDGTLVIFQGNPGREGRLAIDICRQMGRVSLLLDILRQSAFSASQELAAWEEIHQAGTLYVAGNAETECEGIQRKAAQILEAAFFLVMTDTGLSRPLHGPQAIDSSDAAARPISVEAILNQLCQVLSLRDRARIARLEPTELATLNISLGQYIRKHYGLGNPPEDTVLELCRIKSGHAEMTAEDAIAFLIRRLWDTLSQTHTLRRVK